MIKEIYSKQPLSSSLVPVGIMGLGHCFGALTFLKFIEMDIERTDQLSSYGMIGDEKFVCQYVLKHTSKGIWFGDNPLYQDTSVLFIQIIVMYIVGRIIYLLLRPCHQTFLISQIVVSYFFSFHHN